MARRYRRLEAGDDLGDVVAVELLDRGVEVRALFALDEQLGDLGAAREVLRFDLAHLALLDGRLPLGVQRAEGVLGELALVLLERGLGLRVPDLALLLGQVLPGEADDLAQRAVVRFELGRDVLVLDERRAEEDERVWRARDVVLGPLLGVRGAARRDAPRRACVRLQIWAYDGQSLYAIMFIITLDLIVHVFDTMECITRDI